MLDFIMKLFGYENIKNIEIPEGYKSPRTDKMRCKASFYATTGKFLDIVVINKDNVLLDGYITVKLCEWNNIKYVKVIKIDTGPELYKVACRGYRLRKTERKTNYARNYRGNKD